MEEQKNIQNSEKSPVSEQIPPQKTMFKITLKDNIFAIVLLICSVFLSVFGVFGGFSGGFTVTAIILTLAISIYLLGKGYKFKPFSFICLILGLLISLNFLLTSNSTVNVFSFIAFMLLIITWFTSTVRDESHKGDIGFVGHILSPLAETVANLPTTFSSFLNQKKKESKTAKSVLTGMLISLPVLLVVIPLLINSDAAFSGMVNLIFKQSFNIIIKTVPGIFIAIYAVSYAFSLKKGEPLFKKEFSLPKVEPAIIISFLSVLSVCYLSYLFSQLAYFFDAFKGFLPQGYQFTVSAYARRGFFEMSVIAAINFIVIFICRLLSKKICGKSIVLINIFSTFISMFTLIIISTALSKMFLYIKNFGMTELRITTSAFMFFLAAVFVALLLGLYIKKINVIKTAFVTAGIVLALLGTFNVNSFIANYNYTAYQNGDLEEIDVSTIAELGDEGIPYLILLTEDENPVISDAAVNELSMAYDLYYYIERDQNDQYICSGRIYDQAGEFNIPRQKAYNLLDEYLEKNPYILHFEYAETE